MNDKLIWNSGLRYTFTSLKSNLVENDFFDFPFEQIKLNHGSLNGSLGLVYLPETDLKLNAMISTGAPNVDDAAKIFDSEPGSVSMPTPDLKPETSYNFEYGVWASLKPELEIEFTNYFTSLRDALVRRPFTFNGESRILYDGILSDVFAETNVGRALIWGISAKIKAQLTDQLSFRTTYNFINGETLLKICR